MVKARQLKAMARLQGTRLLADQRFAKRPARHAIFLVWTVVTALAARRAPHAGALGTRPIPPICIRTRQSDIKLDVRLAIGFAATIEFVSIKE